MNTALPRRSPHVRVGDVVMALAVGTFEIVGTTFAATYHTGALAGHQLDWLGYTLLAVGAASLAARSRHPSAVLAVTGVTTIAYYAVGYPYGPAPIAVAIAVFTVAASGRRLHALVGGALLLVGFFVHALLVDGAAVAGQGMLFAVGWLAAIVGIGEVVRARRAYRAEVERRRHEHLAALEERALQAERTREEEARRRAGEERLRIARELHDVLSHSISMINVQAGVAVHLMDKRPEQVREALLAIKQASKEAMGELRTTLGVLRQVDEEAPRAPAPSLARLDELVARARAVGLPVAVATSGEPRELPAGVDLAAYRIVQEALTNVARHAPGAAATVSIDYGGQDLVVQVDDDGNRGPGGTRGNGGPPHDGRPGGGNGTSGAPYDAQPGGTQRGGGNGIIGMRERAASTGGELEAGPRPEGGFRVRARLPLKDIAHEHGVG